MPILKCVQPRKLIILLLIFVLVSTTALLKCKTTAVCINANYSGGRTTALPTRENVIPLLIQVINLCQSGSLEGKGITEKPRYSETNAE